MANECVKRRKMTKKEYFQPKMSLLLLKIDYLCSIQQGSREYESGMDIDAKGRTDNGLWNKDIEWGDLW